MDFWEKNAKNEMVPTPLGLSIILGVPFAEVLVFAATCVPGENPPESWRESGAARLTEYQQKTGDYSKDFIKLVSYFAVRDGIA